MKLRWIAILFLFSCVIASAAAHAQAGVYAMFDAQQFTRSGLLATPPAGSSNTDSPWLYGTTFGAFYSISHLPLIGKVPTGPVAVGVDARGTIVRTNSAYNRDEAIVSLRVTPKGALFSVKPYVQGGAGLGHTRIPGQTFYTNNWNFEFAAGVDRKLTKLIDWRVAEVSGGFMRDFVSGSNVNNSNHILNFATGLVVRFP